MNILTVIDMQNDFIDGVLGTKEAVSILPSALKYIKGFNGNILATRDTHYKNYLETEEGRNLPIKHCIYGTTGWRLNDEIASNIKNDPIDKYTFGSIELGEAVLKIHRESKVDSITLIGLCTDICVISNALLLKSFVPDVPILVNSSCCAGTTPENHRKALEIMACCYINIVNFI